MRRTGCVRFIVIAAALVLAAGCDRSQRDAPAVPPDAVTRGAVSETPSGGDDAAPEAGGTFALTVPGRGVLTLMLPAGMTASPAESSVPGGAAVRLEGTGPEPYVITLTVVGVPGMMPGFGTGAWLAEELDRWKNALPEPGLAADAVPVEFQLDAVHGLYLNLEDPSLQPGQYPYLLQGFFDVDGCIVAFQTLHHASRASAVNRFLAVLKDADWQPETAPPRDAVPPQPPETETPPDVPAAY